MSGVRIHSGERRLLDGGSGGWYERRITSGATRLVRWTARELLPKKVQSTTFRGGPRGVIVRSQEPPLTLRAPNISDFSDSDSRWRDLEGTHHWGHAQTSRPSPGGRRFSGFALPFLAPSSSTFRSRRFLCVLHFSSLPAVGLTDASAPALRRNASCCRRGGAEAEREGRCASDPVPAAHVPTAPAEPSVAQPTFPKALGFKYTEQVPPTTASHASLVAAVHELKAAGLTQTALAEQLGMSGARLSQSVDHRQAEHRQ
jgi:hypothetical protein